jgi:hypothetical protein
MLAVQKLYVVCLCKISRDCHVQLSEDMLGPGHGDKGMARKLATSAIS